MLIKTKSIKKYSVLLSALMLSACTESKPTVPQVIESTAQMAPVELTIGEGFNEPLGYYESQPRFSWKIAKNSDLNTQTAYQIQVAEQAEFFENNELLWDSDKVLSDDTSWIQYQGTPLSSRQKVYWRVRNWGKNDLISDWSEPKAFELGLLNNNDWQAQWIGHPDTQLDKTPSQALLATPQYFRKTFSVKKDIIKARLYISAKGLFKPFINNAAVSNEDVMTPGWTPYAQRIESLTYDLTNHIKPGENVIAASLAGGWYAGRAFDQHEQDHRKPARLLAQLEVTYADGNTQIIPSDTSWSVTQNGPIRFASIYDGERYQQSMEMPGWTTTNFEDKSWKTAIAEPLEQNVKIVPKRHAPIRITEQLPVKEIVGVKGDVAIFDFGQNMVGVPKIKIPVIAGKKVKIRFAEALHKGEFYTDNYRSAESTDYYLPNKTGEIEYQPTYTYHGYRYIEISGFDENKQPEKSWATAMVQHSDMALHASFESSHDKLNKLSSNIVWGMRSNFYDIPLDCPQRDERLGWTGDAQVFATPSMYMGDVYAFWSAWLQSVREEQNSEGKVPLYIPFIDWKIKWTSSGWGDVATIIPWELYTITGDKTILADNYDMMQGWVNYHQKKSDKFISNMMTFGDWLQPYPTNLKDGDNGNRGNTDFNLIGTAYFAHSVELTKQAAQVLNKPQDHKELSLLHDKIKQAFNQHFFDEQLNLKQGVETQTTYLLGLAYNLFPQNKRDLAVDKLLALIEEADSHLRTGFLGTPLLTQVLQDVGRSDVIYDLLFKETYPSWFYSINNGATTTWERWNSYSIEDGFNPQGMNSLNHYAYGTISRWFYEGILGIKPAKPGFKEINIEPQFGDQLTQANGSYTTPQGEVSVSWNTKGNQLVMDVVVPKNTVANIILPTVDVTKLSVNGDISTDMNLSNIQPGEYHIRGNIKGNLK
ncbi:alpha-L-rhamnosidase [Catenovulum adriaticum]|uniref:alpha-L-rhamnosidase n=1 Tax=Catenovulum adriaticum TaxID=2984846 RepID=A0ABY7ARI7_9ALTE|nr:alpha-L-rhamnosidase [Catenovulum sp. TS8]WAJ71736.1 glycoside hydrolase family 78 protein [Catenovulum sp. TS8]